MVTNCNVIQWQNMEHKLGHRPEEEGTWGKTSPLHALKGLGEQPDPPTTLQIN